MHMLNIYILGGRLLSALAAINNLWIVNAPGPYNIGKPNIVDNVGRILSENHILYLDPNLKVPLM